MTRAQVDGVCVLFAACVGLAFLLGCWVGAP